MDGPGRAERWPAISFVAAIAMHLAVVLALPYRAPAFLAALPGIVLRCDVVVVGRSSHEGVAFPSFIPGFTRCSALVTDRSAPRIGACQTPCRT